MGFLINQVQLLLQVRLIVHLPAGAQQKGHLLASEDPDARNSAAAIGSKEDGAGEGILPQLVQA